MDYREVAKVKDIPKGEMKMFEVKGKQITIANVEGEFFAFSDICTHAQCNLHDEGELEGKIIECPCHGAKFDIETGEVKALPAIENLPTYPVKIKGNEILIKI